MNARTFALAALALALTACGTTNTIIPLTPAKERLVTGNNRAGNSMVQQFQAETGQDWGTHVAAYYTECVLPAFPEGHRVELVAGRDGNTLTYAFHVVKPDVTGETVNVDTDVSYSLRVTAASGNVEIGELGNPNVSGVGLAAMVAQRIGGQFGTKLAPLGDCPQA